MYDCIIVGSGPAGLSAAVHMKTYEKSFIWFGSDKLSEKVLKAKKIVNYIGFPEISGPELAQKFHEHMEHAGIQITEKTVTTIMSAGDYYMVLADNEIFEAKTVILATGVLTARVLKGEDELLGKGVSYCATCDGMFFKGKKIAVICNDPKFEHEVSYLADLAEEVYYFPTFQSEIVRENVKISKDSPVEICGESSVQKIILRSGQEVELDGIFCLRNAIAPSKLMPGLAVEEGHVVVDRAMATNMPGCFACGDCTGRPYQYTKAVGEGNVAGHSAVAYLAEQEKK